MEITFHAPVRTRAAKRERQWSQQAIARTMPALLDLFSCVMLLAHDSLRGRHPPVPSTAWYHRAAPTYSDALALVRRRLWTRMTFPTSPCPADGEKVPRAMFKYLADLLCYTA